MRLQSMKLQSMSCFKASSTFKGQLSLQSANKNKSNVGVQKSSTSKDAAIKKLTAKKNQLQKKLMKIDKQKISTEEKEKLKKSVQEEIKALNLQIQQIKSPSKTKSKGSKGTKIDTFV